jgi:tight adherence protein C
MKAVAERREEAAAQALRPWRRPIAAGPAAIDTVGFMKRTVDDPEHSKARFESPGMKEKAGPRRFRGQAPVVAFMFFRFVMPPVLLLGALIYLFGISTLDWASHEMLAAIGARGAGYYSPDIYVSNRIQSRRDSIMRAFPMRST